MSASGLMSHAARALRRNGFCPVTRATRGQASGENRDQHEREIVDDEIAFFTSHMHQSRLAATCRQTQFGDTR